MKLPLNSSYSPVIQIHNPHQSTIQVGTTTFSGSKVNPGKPPPGSGDVLKRRRSPPRAAWGRLGSGRQLVADPALPHQAGHEGHLPGKGWEQPHRLYQVIFKCRVGKAGGLDRIYLQSASVGSCLINTDVTVSPRNLWLGPFLDSERDITFSGKIYAADCFH